MADTPEIQAILAALASSQSHAGTPHTQGGSMPPYQSSNAPPQARYPPPTVPTPSYHSTGYVLPQPAVTGNVDLSNVRPVGSGTVSIADSIAQARAFAAEKGVASYDRPLIYASANGRPGDAHHHPSRSRSRSPQGRRDGGGYRDNPYRDERRGRGAGDDRGGRREYRDRSYSSGPRDRDRDARSQNRGRPGAGGLDDNSEIIPIESSLVGLIIGRQGENLRRIEAESACRVQFLPPSTEQTSFRQCKISGPPLQRSQVKDAINKIIDDNGMGALNRQVDRTGRAGPELRDGEDHVKMSVPDRTVGLIIGRGGETIRDLQEKSGCHINIVDEKQSINGLRPVNLIGTPEAARMARMLILQIVETDNQSHDPSRGDPGNPNGDLGYASQPAESAIGPVSGGEKTNDKIYVPSDTVGMIIGKGGETIRDIQQQTGCKINVMQAALGAAPDSQREINLIGSRDSIERAKAAIFEKVDVAKQRSGAGGGGGGGFGSTQTMGNAGAGAPRNRPYNNNNTNGYSQGRSDYHDAYAPQAGNVNPQQAAASAGGSAAGSTAGDPYAPWGGYEKYVRACWAYMQQQQSAGAATTPGGAAPLGQ